MRRCRSTPGGGARRLTSAPPRLHGTRQLAVAGAVSIGDRQQRTLEQAKKALYSSIIERGDGDSLPVFDMNSKEEDPSSTSKNEDLFALDGHRSA